MPGGTTDSKKLYVPWADYIKMISDLAFQMKDEKFTDIIGISRGGLIPAQLIAYQLNVRRVHCFGISSYSETNERLTGNDVNIYQRITVKFNKDCNILIVDDVADSGLTFKRCVAFHYDFESANKYKLCALHYKPCSVIKPDYFAQEVPAETWITYPYDVLDIIG